MFTKKVLIKMHMFREQSAISWEQASSYSLRHIFQVNPQFPGTSKISVDTFSTSVAQASVPSLLEKAVFQFSYAGNMYGNSASLCFFKFYHKNHIFKNFTCFDFMCVPNTCTLLKTLQHCTHPKFCVSFIGFRFHKNDHSSTLILERPGGRP